MEKDEKFLVDVGMENLPFPMKVLSKKYPDGQQTVANISIWARIMREFEARWIDKFVQIVHRHRDSIGSKTLKNNILDYLKELQATAVNIDFSYPFFIEKLTPVTGEKCLVQYLCTYAAKATSTQQDVSITFKVDVPIITTYPVSTPETLGGLFGQLSMVTIKIISQKDIYPEDVVEMVDKHALAPVYSFLAEKDQHYLIQKIHSQRKTSVQVLDEIKEELSRNLSIEWYSVRSSNYGMLHAYSTVIGIEKSMWVPFSSHHQEEI